MEREELQKTGEGIALRAGLLAAGGLLIGVWLVTLVARVASAAVHILLIAGLGLLGAGYLTWKVKRFEHRHPSDEWHQSPAL